MKSKSDSNSSVSIDNIYRLNGRVPIAEAIPFGLQHVLAMFVSNLAPITIIAAAAQPALSQEQIGMLLQNAMFIAGIATLIQLYPVWRIGARLPIVMGVSFTFVTILCSIAAKQGYPAMLGAVLVGGIMEVQHGADIIIRIPSLFESYEYVIAIQVKDYEGFVSDHVLFQIRKADTFFNNDNQRLIEKIVIVTRAEKTLNEPLADCGDVRFIFAEDLRTLLYKISRLMIGNTLTNQ